MDQDKKEIFKLMEEHGHEQVLFCRDEMSELEVVVAIHDTTLGPGLGGTRMWDYDTEKEALKDALRLSAGMTKKSAAARCNYGGAKAVIWGSPEEKTEQMLRAYGNFVESLNGRFITGTDAGTSYYDFVPVSRQTRHLVALPQEYGGSGDSSEVTAYGVIKGMEACARWVHGDSDLGNLTVAIQGMGKVGSHLVEYLSQRGSRLIITDIDDEKVKKIEDEFAVEVVEPDAIYGVECDVFSPCALGGVLNDRTIARLRCGIVAGAANNQLDDPESCMNKLQEKDILYAPDYIINAGGLIQVAEELAGHSREDAFQRAEKIEDLLLEIFAMAEQKCITTREAAARLAEDWLRRIGTLNQMHL